MKRPLTLLLALCSALSVLALTGKDAEVKTARHTVKVSATDVIHVMGKNTFVEIESWDKDEVEIFAQVTFDGKMNDRTHKFLDGFEQEVLSKIGKSGGELLIDTDLETPNKVQIGSRNAGVIISYGDEELRIEYSLKVPGKNFLKVKSAYKDLVLNGPYDQVDITQYSAGFRAGALRNAKLNLKYGKAQIQSIGEGGMESYENDTEIKEAEVLTINDKYSDLTVGTVDKLTITGYETDIRLGKCETLKGDLKYGDVQIGDKVGFASLTLYENDIRGEAFGNLRLENSKYSKINLDRAHEVIFTESYEDELSIRYLNILETKSKYGDYRIEQLGKRLILNGYEDDVFVGRVLSDAEKVEVDGKYLTIELGMQEAPYALNTQVKYGKVDYNESTVEVRKLIRENDNLTIEAESKMGSKIPVTIRGYEVKATLR